MRIQEIESITGLTRANIRFYEKKGLLETKRSKNGFRDYSEGNLDTLFKIKLLRQLNVSIGDIYDMQRSKLELSTVLEKRQAEIVRERKDLENSKMVCQEICENQISYQQLDASKYLSLLEKEIIYMKRNHISTAKNIENDVIKYELKPWRCYSARIMDYVFYGTISAFLFFVVLRKQIKVNDSFYLLLILGTSILLAIFLEALLVSKFGTTLGKWILGISVSHIEGRKLTYKEGLCHIIKAIYYGEGVNILNYMRYRTVEDMHKYLNEGEGLPWEEECEYVFKNNKRIRTIAYIVTFVILLFGIYYIRLYSLTPLYRGDISLVNFSANYNKYMDVAVYEDNYLDENGKWKKIEPKKGYPVKKLEEETIIVPRFPQFEYKQVDGVLREVSLTYTLQVKKDKIIYGSLDNEILCAIYSFALAQSEMNTIQITKEMKILAEMVEKRNKFTYYVGNIKIEYKRNNQSDTYYQLDFSMKTQ